MFFKLLALLIGIPWCYYVFRRLPDDIQELRTTKDRTARFAIIFYWILTTGFIYMIIDFTADIAACFVIFY